MGQRVSQGFLGNKGNTVDFVVGTREHRPPLGDPQGTLFIYE